MSLAPAATFPFPVLKRFSTVCDSSGSMLLGLTWLGITRLAVLSAVSFFALVVLGASGNYINLTMHNTLFINGIQLMPVTSADPFSALNVAVGLFTLLSAPAMLAIDFIRRGAITSMIVFELSWLGFLWIIWLAAAAYTADVTANALLCQPLNVVTVAQTACTDARISTGFGFLIWLCLSAYVGTLLTLSIMTHMRGAPQVWKSSVRDANFQVAGLGLGKGVSGNGEMGGGPEATTMYMNTTGNEGSYPMSGGGYAGGYPQV